MLCSQHDSRLGNAMTPDDLTRPLRKSPTNQRRHGIVLLIVAGTLSGVLSGLAIFFTADRDRGEPVLPTRAPQPALADSVQQTATPFVPAVQATPTAKTITLTIIDSQTGAKREVVLPAPTNDQSEGDLSLRSTATSEGRANVSRRPGGSGVRAISGSK